jgi:hypothetical protein
MLALAPIGLLERAPRAETRSTTEAGRVLLVVAAEPGEAKALGQVATELLGRLSVTVELRRVARIDLAEVGRPSDGARYLARIYVDLRRADSAALFFVDSAHDRILIREIARPPGSEEVAREELGHIFETSTEGLLSGAEIGVPRADVLPMLEPDKKEKPSPAVEITERRAWQASLLYELEVLAGPAYAVQGPEAGLFIRLPSRKPELGVWASGQYRFPLHVDADPVSARLEGGALRVGLALDVPIRTTMRIRTGLGGGVDLVDVQPETSDPSGVALASGELVLVAVARATLGLEVRLSSALSFWSRIAVDLDPSGTQYVFQRRTSEDLVLRPWPVRPALAIGIGFP